MDVFDSSNLQLQATVHSRRGEENSKKTVWIVLAVLVPVLLVVGKNEVM